MIEIFSEMESAHRDGHFGLFNFFLEVARRNRIFDYSSLNMRHFYDS